MKQLQQNNIISVIKHFPGHRYNKVIVTDDLKMRAIRLIYGPRFAFKKAFEAGNDIIVFRYNQKEEEKCYLQIVNMVKENKINIGRINRSVKRILKLKQKYKLNNSTINGIRKY